MLKTKVVMAWTTVPIREPVAYKPIFMVNTIKISNNCIYLFKVRVLIIIEINNKLNQYQKDIWKSGEIL